MRAPSLSVMSPQHTEKTSSGFDANVAAALSYLVGFVTGIGDLGCAVGFYK